MPYLRVTRGRYSPYQYMAVINLVPSITTGFLALPGCQDVRIGFNIQQGTIISVATFDTFDQALAPPEQLGEPMQALLALGWQEESVEVFDIR